MTTAPLSILGKIIYTAAGLLLGVILSLLLFTVLATDKTENPEPKNLNLVVTTPQGNLATDKKSFTLVGDTTSDSVVTVNSPLTNTIVQTKNGKFSAKLDLTEGKNVINITAFDPKTGSSQTTTKEILYLNEDLSSL